MKVFRCLLAAVLLMPVFALVQADQKKGNECNMRGGHDRESMEIGGYASMKKDLNLTDDQVKQLNALKSDFMKANVKSEADIKLARIDMMDLMKKQPPDFDGMKEKVKAIDTLELNQKLAGIDARQKGYNLLTPDQQKMLPGLMKAKWGHRKDMKKEDKKEKDEK